ncbi:ribosomal protein S18-alanine N-acetyltransferase [Shewanella sp. JM162201]|uniref:[Ribosomal protein bS18]-alanine N-acetyltransferase n=1 Tax=Shewanella jiangmenensis TaxID=2837387 RepID=A0ABS5V3V7_9GAMM|nr:ribosomal protein S18-alanine N-acetyltransferase [Shewanella jiangmenensis]MBT1444623.1 ribosomal protein S18-alanine N-acetyltransferase [Shewanella jiangmenensis]
MELVTLTPVDTPLMAQIEAQAHSHPMTEGMLKDCFGPLYRVLGLKLDGELVGFAIVQQIVDEATLFDICIKPEMQGRGLGVRLMDHLIGEARDSGASVLMLEVRASNVAAIGLYRKLGFTEAGRRPNYYPLEGGAGREDALLMDLRLS